METAKKPEIISTIATVKVPTEGELIRKLNDKLPEISNQINENRRKAHLSAMHMRYGYLFKNRGKKNDF